LLSSVAFKRCFQALLSSVAFKRCFQALLSSVAFKRCFQALLSSVAFNVSLRRYVKAPAPVKEAAPSPAPAKKKSGGIFGGTMKLKENVGRRRWLNLSEGRVVRAWLSIETTMR